MGKDFKLPVEWLRQAEYDLETAEAMFKAKRFIYTVFMCHLAIEKMLKALYTKAFEKSPSKTHDLIYLFQKIEMKTTKQYLDFLKSLNDLSVLSRYPDELERLMSQFTESRTQGILEKTKEVFLWLRKRLQE